VADQTSTILHCRQYTKKIDIIIIIKLNEFKVLGGKKMKLTQSYDNIRWLEIFKRPAALIDVDHTLVYTSKDGQVVLNQRLLRALKQQNIKDVYLFTDMIITQSFIEDRLKLIEALKNEGFFVHGCITPLDYFWDTDQNLLERFNQACMEEKIILKNNAHKNKEKLPAVMAQFPEINERVKSEVYPKFGQAFAEAIKTKSIKDEAKKQEIVSQLTVRSIWCKNATDAVSELKGLKSCKGISFGQFLSHLLSWVSAIYVFDDQQDNYHSVNAVSQNFKMSVPLYNYHGEFTDKTESFADQLAPTPIVESTPNESDETLTSRMKGIANDAINHFHQFLKSVTFRTTRFQKELQRATTLCRDIINSEDDFKDQWDYFLFYLKGLFITSKSDFKFSEFDKKMLELISKDSEICKAVGWQESDNLKSSASGQSQSFDHQSFAHELLGNTLKNMESPRRNFLTFSTGILPKLKLTRSVDASLQEVPKTPGSNPK